MRSQEEAPGWGSWVPWAPTHQQGWLRVHPATAAPQPLPGATQAGTAHLTFPGRQQWDKRVCYETMWQQVSPS